MPKVRLPKPTPLEYGFMIGGPVAFLLVALLGIRALVGPLPKPNPIDTIRGGDIKSGMSLDEVEDRLGMPNDIDQAANGSMTLHYRRTAWDDDRKELAQNEGSVIIDPNGRVLNATVERLTPPAPRQSN